VSAQVTPALERAAVAVARAISGYAPDAIARDALAAALDVEEIARAIYGSDAGWDLLDAEERGWYLDDAYAVRAAILGGAA
jgi:O-methyltransferase involved in polyketide biosynthesis